MLVRRTASGRSTCFVIGAIVAVTLVIACIVIALALAFVTVPGIEERDDTAARTEPLVEPVGETVISVLDVDQGQAVLVVAPDGSTALIDAGRSQTRIREEIEPYAASLGVQHLDYVILSHPDQDHVGGMPQVLESFSVGTWVDPAIPTANQTYEETIEIVLDRRVPAILARQGQTLTLGTSVSLSLLWPVEEFITSGGEPDSNENSVVVMVSVGEIEVLIPGDLEQDGEQALVDQMAAALQAEILVVGHHGSNTSTTAGFLDAVNAEVAIISAGEDNPYGHPHGEVLQRLRFRDTDIYRTDLDGTIEIHIDDGYRIETVETDQDS